MSNNAIYEGQESWDYSKGTNLKGDVVLPNGKVNSESINSPISDEVYFIVPINVLSVWDFMKTSMCSCLSCGLLCLMKIMLRQRTTLVKTEIYA